MGGGESKSFVWNGGMSAEQALLGSVTLRLTKFHIPKDAGTESDFTITDDQGAPWLRVDRTSWSLRDKTVLFNAETGEPVVVIKSKLRSLFRSEKDYRILTFAPNQPDQESTFTFEGAPLYHFAKLKASAGGPTAPCSISYSRCIGNDDS